MISLRPSCSVKFSCPGTCVDFAYHVISTGHAVTAPELSSFTQHTATTNTPQLRCKSQKKGTVIPHLSKVSTSLILQSRADLLGLFKAPQLHYGSPSMLLNASKCELPKGNWLIPTALLQANTLRFLLELDVKSQLQSLMSILTEHLDGDIQK